MHQSVQLPSNKLRPLVLACLTALSTLNAPANAAGNFIPLSDLAGGNFSSAAYGVSADGTVVVGAGTSSTNVEQAFRWTQAGGMQSLGSLDGGLLGSEASSVSGNGAVVVGESNSTNGIQAFRWTQAGGMVGLGDLAGGSFFSVAEGVNADGSVVVGRGIGANGFEAFRWTQAGGMLGIGDLAGGTFHSEAFGVSADGSVVVGSGSSANGSEAFRWTQASGMVGLGDLVGGVFYSEAFAVSADGTVVVGDSLSANGSEAFRWTQAGGMQGLGDLAGGAFNSEAFGVSADGSVVVGDGTTANGEEAFRWTQAGGMVRVADWLTAAGAVLPAGYFIDSASAVSADGSVVVGTSTGPNGEEAYLARVSAIGSGLINPVVFNQSVLVTANRSIEGVASLPSIILQGAHHRTILDTGLVRTANGACAWATGDIGRFNTSDAKAGMVEVGVCKDFGTARIGVGIGQNWAKQDSQLDGQARYRGQHVLLEAANAFDNGLQPSVIAYYGSFDATLNRNYQNGGAIDTSRGTPDATAKAIKLRLDWKDLATLGNASISPYAAYTWQSTKLDGYTETGGGFPVRYDSNHWNTNDIRIGAAGNFAIGASTNLRLGAEAVHRFDDNVSGTSGQVLGLGSFKAEGVEVKQTWVRTLADIDYKLTEQLLITAGANVGSGGGDTSWGLTAGLRASF